MPRLAAVCGGCNGTGRHRRLCPRHPRYSPWRLVSDQVDQLAEVVGDNEPDAATKLREAADLLTRKADNEADDRAKQESGPWWP